jgi:hypothetical protein
MSDEVKPDPLDEYDLRQARENYDAFVQRAIEHHERTGEWPPDPILDEIDEIRREIMAEHGNDWRKVLQWHREQDELFVQQNPNARFAEKPVRSGGASRP